MTTSTDAPRKRDLAELLQGFEPDARSPYSVTVQKTLYLAHALQERANRLQSPSIYVSKV